MSGIFDSFREWTEPAERTLEKTEPTEPPEMEEFSEYMRNYELENETIHFTEGTYEGDGRFEAGQVYEIDAEAAEFDPEIAELSCELNSWFRQSEPMSCAVAAQTMAVSQLERSFYSEGQFIEIGKENGWYNNGTYWRDVGKIAEYAGEDVEQRHLTDTAELKIANDPEVKVLAGVDHTLLQYPESGKRCQPDHVVQVLRIESREEGEFVILNDPGREDGRGAVYPMEVFEKAFNGDITLLRKEKQI